MKDGLWFMVYGLWKMRCIRFCAINYKPSTIHYSRGFTLIETLVAVSMLSVAIVAPMTLVSKSLASAYYARDQVTAFFLAQEAVEAVRHLRDHNTLIIAEGAYLDPPGPPDLFAGVPIGSGNDFIIDTRTDNITKINDTGCGNPTLKTDSTFYGYGTNPCLADDSPWTPTSFSRMVHAEYVAGSSNNEVRLTVTVSWKTGASFVQRSFTISDNLYRWVNDGR